MPAACTSAPSHQLRSTTLLTCPTAALDLASCCSPPHHRPSACLALPSASRYPIEPSSLAPAPSWWSCGRHNYNISYQSARYYRLITSPVTLLGPVAAAPEGHSWSPGLTLQKTLPSCPQNLQLGIIPCRAIPPSSEVQRATRPRPPSNVFRLSCLGPAL